MRGPAIPRARVARLPRSGGTGLPVPYFVANVDGQPDFRVVDREALRRCVQHKLCWICGQPLGAWSTFVLGPVCAITRVSAEPPSHQDCAEYAAQACPFLVNPARERRAANRPEHTAAAPGDMIERNPGVALVWTARNWAERADRRGARLFDIGEPVAVAWFAAGRAATRKEVLKSLSFDAPTLRATVSADGPAAVAAFEDALTAALMLAPV